MDYRGVPRSTLVAFLVLAALLAVVGTVTYRTINRLSEADLANQRRSLSSAMINFRRGFSGAIGNLTQDFDIPIWTESTDGLKKALTEHYQNLIEEGAELDLISQMGLLDRSSDGSAAYFEFDRDERAFEEIPIPEAYISITDPPPPPSDFAPPRPGRTEARLYFREGRLLLAIPYGINRRGRRMRGPLPFARQQPRFEPGGRGIGGGGPSRASIVVLELNRNRLNEQVFTELKQTHFTGQILSGVELAVRGGPSQFDFYQSNPGLDPGFFTPPDDTLPLVTPAGWLFPFNFGTGSNEEFPAPPGPLMLLARHRAGSLEAEIGRGRSRDRLVAFAVLALLAAAATTLIVSVQKTRNLAKRQMDFVAGISHELRNPLTALQSAGFNLSRGSIREEDKIRQYGLIITRESRRLTHMVEQVLSYAGIQNSGGQYRFQHLRIEELLATVLQEYQPVFEEEGWELEMEVKSNLPKVLGDRKALESCFRNLVDNALKYAAEGKWLSVRARAAEEAGRVEVSVQDRGKGISRADLSSIFEPFYRGDEQVASSTPGTGLGLALVKRHVEAHGGNINVTSPTGQGTRFLLSFPSAQAIEESELPKKDHDDS